MSTVDPNPKDPTGFPGPPVPKPVPAIEPIKIPVPAEPVKPVKGKARKPKPTELSEEQYDEAIKNLKRQRIL
jgi:hypothetical protein